MTRLLNRDLRLIVGPITIDARTAAGERQPLLKATFDITKTSDKTPNEAVVAIWNLREENRTALQEKNLEVIIEAGYVDERNQIFKGDIETTTITREAVDWVTTVELGDGTKQLKQARINESLRGPQSAGDVLKKAAQALGLDPGNLEETATRASVLKQFVNNVILSGKASDVLDEIASGINEKYSVQDKKLQFLGRGRSLAGPPVILNQSKGLLGSPQVGEKGVVTAKSLLNGRIRPGVKIQLTSLLLSGDYIAQKVRHIGDTWGAQWETQIEMVQA